MELIKHTSLQLQATVLSSSEPSINLSVSGLEVEQVEQQEVEQEDENYSWQAEAENESKNTNQLLSLVFWSLHHHGESIKHGH